MFSVFLKPIYICGHDQTKYKVNDVCAKTNYTLESPEKIAAPFAKSYSRQHIAIMTTPTSPPPPSTAKIVITISIIASAIICCVPGLWQVIIGCLTDHHPHHRPFYSHHDYE